MVRVLRHPMYMHEGNGLGDVHILKVVDDFRDDLSRDVYREGTGRAGGHR